ncbi:methyltransferase [Ghiorsea bivora]|uniref:methyltransferase n=1 Tax=Ghiorsea bivora TaxID=1485545 RepID=UPI00068AB176|nr:methyltransferase [Ghiorsea bivora]
MESPVLSLLLKAAINAAPKRVAFINVTAHPLLLELTQQAGECVLSQTFKPYILDLDALGLSVSDMQGQSKHAQPNHTQFDLVLLIPSKDKKQSLGWMAQAFALLNEHGKLMVACENQYGAKSYESALKKLAGQVAASSKRKCRLFSAKKTATLNVGLQQQWLDASQPSLIESHGLWAQAGLFSWKTADIGSQFLLKHLPVFQGKGMDLCCGYGLLAAHVLKTSQSITHLHLVEAERSALDCAKKNVADIVTDDGVVSFHHLDAANENLPRHLNFVVCNPPFHTGQSRDVELGQTIVNKACGALTHGGELYLVANRQLPYEHILKAHLREVECLAVGDGFKVIRGKK